MTLERDAPPSAGGGENYYEVLGLARGAPAEEIEAAYEDLSAMFAAGKVPASRQEYARKQRTRLAGAYATLADPEQRAAYDRRLEAAPATPLDSSPPEEPAAAADTIPSHTAADTIAPAAAAEADTIALAPGGLTAPAELATPAAAPAALPPGPGVLPWAQAADEVPLSEPLGAVDALGPATSAPLATEQEIADRAHADDEDAGPAYPEDNADDEDADLAYEDGADDEDADLEYEEDADDDAGEEPEAPLRTAPTVGRYVPAAAARPQSAANPAGTLPTRGPLPPAPDSRRPGAPPASGVRVEPARPAARAGQPPAPAPPRAGGVLLPSRREAALITARQTNAPPAPTRAMSAPRRPVARPDRPVDYEEDLRPRGRMAPPPPVRRKRSRKATNQFAYQVMVLVIALVLIVGTAASVLGGTITTGGTTIQPTANPVDLVNTGNTLVGQQNWASAEQVFEQALQIQPTNVNAMLGLVHVYEGRHNPTDAAQAQSYATQIIKTDPNSAAAKEAIGVLTSLSLTPKAIPPTAPAAAATAIQATGVPANAGSLATAPASASAPTPRAATTPAGPPVVATPPAGGSGVAATPQP